MKKNVAIKAMLASCASLALLGGALAIAPETQASANNSQTVLVEPTTFAAVTGAQVRKTVGSSGIRFSTLINDTWLDETLAGKTVEYGYLVAENLADGVELTEENGAKVKADVLLDVDVNDDDTTDFYRYNFSITEIPTDKYETKVSARAYVTIDGETQYGETQTRAIAQVAASAFAAGEADPDNVISGYVNQVAQSVAFEETAQKLNKATITTETTGLAVTTQPAGYAVKLTSSNENVAKIVDGKIVPQAQEGKATLTAQFGTNKTASYELTVVSYSATLGGAAIAEDTKATVKVADGYFASITNPYGAASVATQASNASEQLVIKEYDGTTYGDVTSTADYEYSLAGVVTVEDGTLAGGTVNGTTTVSAKIDGYEVANFDVEGWTEITTIAQMNELSLVTWRQRNNATTVKAVLGGKYVLGANLAYNGAYILPIANAAKSVSNTKGTDINDNGNLTDDTGIFSSDTSATSMHSWVWKDILEVIEPVEEGQEAGTWKEWWGVSTSSKSSWPSTEYNNAFLRGSNPLGVSFTGVFDGNGYTISDAQILDVNYLYIKGGLSKSTAAGGCFIGLLGEGGVLKNVNFEELRWIKYYGTTSAERETQLSATTYPDTCVWFYDGNDTGTQHTGGNDYVRYGNSIVTNSQSGLVIVNQGLISDVRLSSYYRSSGARYTNGALNSNNKNHAFGAVVNDSTGVINNFVVELLPGEIEYLRMPDHDEETMVNWQSALLNKAEYGNNIFYSRNYGTVQNSIFFSDVPDGKKLPTNFAQDNNGTWHAVSYIWAYGNTEKDYNVSVSSNTNSETGVTTYYYNRVNGGTVTNCAGYFGDGYENALNAFKNEQPAGTDTYPGTHVNTSSYSTDLWDLTTFSFKQK